MSCLYSTACVYGVTALTVAIWSIPLLFVVIWRLTKASVGILGFGFSRFARTDFFDPSRQLTHQP